MSCKLITQKSPLQPTAAQQGDYAPRAASAVTVTYNHVFIFISPPSFHKRRAQVQVELRGGEVKAVGLRGAAGTGAEARGVGGDGERVGAGEGASMNSVAPLSSLPS